MVLSNTARKKGVIDDPAVLFFVALKTMSWDHWSRTGTDSLLPRLLLMKCGHRVSRLLSFCVISLVSLPTITWLSPSVDDFERKRGENIVSFSDHMWSLFRDYMWSLLWDHILPKVLLLKKVSEPAAQPDRVERQDGQESTEKAYVHSEA